MRMLAELRLEEFAHRAARIVGHVAATAGLVLTLATPSQAAPILINGGFETTDFTGWTETGDNIDAFDGVQCSGPGPTILQGRCSAYFSTSGAAAGITQAVTGLVTGGSYVVSFGLFADGGIPSSFSASFGGQTLVSLINPPASPYRVFNFVQIATGTSEALAFSFRDDPGFLFLDAVSVAVPEPTSIALIGAGLMGFLWVRRRKAPRRHGIA
jgi:hypothetical protein